MDSLLLKRAISEQNQHALLMRERHGRGLRGLGDAASDDQWANVRGDTPGGGSAMEPGRAPSAAPMSTTTKVVLGLAVVGVAWYLLK